MAAAMTVASVNAATKPALSKLNISKVCPTGLFQGNMQFIDVNNDGNLELLVKGRDVPNGWANTIKILTGDGYGYNSAININDPDGCSWQRVVVPIDFNCDGNMDFLLASSWNAKLMQGDGKGGFTMVDPNTFKLDGEISIDGDDSEKWYTGLVGVADFNGDGYPDILTFCGNPREDQGEPTLFINKGGTGEFEKQFGIGLEAQRGGTLAVGDFNNDGNPDVAIAGWIDTNRIRVYANDGKGNFTAMESVNKSFDDLLAGTQNGHIICLDADNDGWLDLFVTGESHPQDWAKQAALYKNNNGTSFTKVSVPDFPGVKKSGADWCDLNGDGIVDFIYAGETDNGQATVVAYANGDGTFSVDSSTIPGKRGGASVAIMDFNNNGKPDAAVMGYGDGDLFELYNNLTSRGTYKAPTAPSKAVAEAEGNSTILSWEAGNASDGAVRYNVYVKTKDGKIFATVPADPATGKLKQGDVNAASTAKSRTINIKKEDIAEWGVQAINASKLASPFTKGGDSSAVEEIAGENFGISYANGAVVCGEAANVTVYNMAGATVASFAAAAGESAPLNVEAGVYVVVAKTAESTATLKVVVK